MVAELELDSELETHLRMFECSSRALADFDWSAVDAERLLDGVRAWTGWTGRHPPGVAVPCAR